NIMANKYIRPAFLNEDKSTGVTVKTLEPAEVVQQESTALETGFSVVLDTKTHRHDLSHTHKYNFYPYNGIYSGHDSGGVKISQYSYLANQFSDVQSLNLSTDPDHDHTFTFLNTITGTKNELNRLTLNPFVRIS
ncbi:MAG: hypothetical protein ACHQ1D_01730, partial [Nitrososphaerales archaeon]